MTHRETLAAWRGTEAYLESYAWLITFYGYNSPAAPRHIGVKLKFNVMTAAQSDGSSRCNVLMHVYSVIASNAIDVLSDGI